MRRQYFYWTYLVLAIVLTVYGGYNLAYHFNHNNKLSVLSLVFLIAGTVMLITYLVLYLLSLKKKHENTQETAPIIDVQPEPEPVEEPKPQTVAAPKPTPRKSDVTYERGSSPIHYDTDAYVKHVGHGPVLRVTGNRILDMRSNTYYRIEGNFVNQEGYGQAYEISGNKIRPAFGGYLYEISGSNINKVFGGFYASISGNYITLFDLSEKYEITDSLNKKQLLVVAALLFGNY